MVFTTLFCLFESVLPTRLSTHKNKKKGVGLFRVKKFVDQKRLNFRTLFWAARSCGVRNLLVHLCDTFSSTVVEGTQTSTHG